MSSYKRLNKADISNVPYVANKQWNYSYDSSSIVTGDITYYRGKKEEFSIIGSKTTNEQYKSLIYDLINHLFYQSYTDNLNTGSLMYNLDTYESASEQRPTSSYFNYNTNPLLVKNLPTSSSSEIVVLNISKDVYGSKILPYTFNISSSLFNIVDDGHGNLDNIITCTSYELGTSGSIYQYQTCSGIVVTESINTNVIRCVDTIYGVNVISSPDPIINNLGICNVTKEHIGNIFYAHGIAIVTNSDYLNLFPTSSTPQVTSSVNLHSLMGPTLNVSASGTGSLYYKIDGGAYNFVGSIYDPTGNPCIDFGSVSVPDGSTLYIAVTSASLNVNFGITEQSCINSFTQPYCGNSSPYSVVVTSSMDLTISPAYALTGSGLKIC